MTDPIELAVIGGSGLSALLDEVETIETTTPWGEPSSPVQIASIGDRRVAFLARHGVGHTIPPHRINSRANLFALRELGVTRVLSPCAVGSLHPDVHPGDLVVLDQILDRTVGRDATYFDGPVVNHVSLADPYCPELQAVLRGAAARGARPSHDTGTVAVIPGPRFSTRAESRVHRDQGATVINMTQMPEAALARELGLCFGGLALVTDYDAGVDADPDRPPVTHGEVFAFFESVIPDLRAVLLDALTAIPAERRCGCQAATNGVDPGRP